MTSAYMGTGVPTTNSSGNKANANAVATLTAGAGQTAYLAGFDVTGTGATSVLIVTVTVAGVTGGTLSYTFTFPAGVTTACAPLQIQFPQPIQGVAATNIVVTCPASGLGGTNLTVNAYGYVSSYG